MKQIVLASLILLYGCSSTYILKGPLKPDAGALRVALVPFVEVTGNYKEDKKGNNIINYLQNVIATKLKSKSCFNNVALCQFNGEPEYLLDSMQIKDGYFKTIKPNVDKSKIECNYDIVLILYNVNIDTMTQGQVFQDVSASTTSLGFYAEYVYWNAQSKNAISCGEIKKEYSSAFPSISVKDWDTLANRIVKELLVEGNYTKKK
jgi:hypothetical protein